MPYALQDSNVYSAGMLNARYSNWLPSNGSVSCLLDVFDANVKRCK